MELLERVVELSLAGYCCSQVMALLLLELLGEEDDGELHAESGTATASQDDIKLEL